MEFMEILRDYVIPFVTALLVGFAAFSATAKTIRGKSIKESLELLLQDELVCDLLDEILKSKTGKDFNTLDEYLEWFKEQLYAKIITYLKVEVKAPDAVINSLTIENISSILENLMDKYNINDLIKENFESVSKLEVEENDDSIDIEEHIENSISDEEIDEVDLGEF